MGCLNGVVHLVMAVNVHQVARAMPVGSNLGDVFLMYIVWFAAVSAV